MSRVASIHVHNMSLAPGATSDVTASSLLLSNPIAITAYADVNYGLGLGYQDSGLSVESVQVHTIHAYNFSSNVIQCKVRNVGKLNVYSFWLYVNEVV